MFKAIAFSPLDDVIKLKADLSSLY